MASQLEFFSTNEGRGETIKLESWTDRSVYSDLTIPNGRQAADGKYPLLITALRGMARGRGGARNLQLSLGSIATSYFSIPEHPSNAEGTNRIPVTPTLLSGGGVQRFTVRSSNGAFWFGRGDYANGSNTPTGGVTTDSYGTTYSGLLGASIVYSVVPAAPVGITILPSRTVAGQLVVTLPTGTHDGGTPIRGYRIFLSTNLDKINSGGYDRYIDTDGHLTQTIDGLPLGILHHFRVAAKNDVSAAANTTGPLSVRIDAVPRGMPSAPRNFSAIASDTIVGAVHTTWVAPEVTGGGITGYDIFKNDVKIATITGIGYTLYNQDPKERLTLYVAARTLFSEGSGQGTPRSNYQTLYAPGTPSAPLNVRATPDPNLPGRIRVTWSPPTDIAGGVVKYSIYRSVESLTIGETSDLFFDVDNLVPGSTYTFYIRAWNAVGVAYNQPGPLSGQAFATAPGDVLPGQGGARAIASPLVAGRLFIESGVGGIYEAYTFTLRPQISGGQKKVINTRSKEITVDNLIPGVTYLINIAARTAYMVSIGAPSKTYVENISGTPLDTTVQTFAPTPIQNLTNKVFNGTQTISVVSATEFSYVKNSEDIPSLAVPSLPVTNITNSDVSVGFNGTYTITSVPTPTTLTYARPSIPAVATDTLVGMGLVTDNTNQQYNTPVGVPAAVTDVDGANGTVSYTASGVPSHSVRPVSAGVVTNVTNTVFNGTNLKVLDVTRDTVTYAKTSKNIPESPATGEILDRTNRDVYNGVYTVASVPSYDSFQYVRDSDGHLGSRANLAFNSRLNETRGITTIRQNFCFAPRGLGVLAPYYLSESQVITSDVGISDHPIGLTKAHRVSYELGSRLPGVTLASDLPAGTYTVSMWIKHELVSPDSRQSFASINNSSEARYPVPTESFWVRESWTKEIKQGASLGFRIASVVGAGGSFLLSGVLVERTNRVNDYFDGSQINKDASWAGIADASRSVISAPTPTNTIITPSTLNYQIMGGGDRYMRSLVVDPVKFNILFETLGTTEATHTMLVRIRANRPGLRLSPVVRGSLGSDFEVPTEWTTMSMLVRRNMSVPATSDIGFTNYGTNWTDTDWVDITEFGLVEGEYAGPFFHGLTTDTQVSQFDWATSPSGSQYAVQTFLTNDADVLPPYGDVLRVSSQANLNVYYRSGWAG